MEVGGVSVVVVSEPLIALGLADGIVVGSDAVRATEGLSEGILVGVGLGITVGPTDGAADGSKLGESVGSTEGDDVG